VCAHGGIRTALAAAVMIPASTYCSSVKMATAFLRMAKVGAGHYRGELAGEARAVKRQLAFEQSACSA
jgi:hypothetical protein